MVDKALLQGKNVQHNKDFYIATIPSHTIFYSIINWSTPSICQLVPPSLWDDHWLKIFPILMFSLEIVPETFVELVMFEIRCHAWYLTSHPSTEASVQISSWAQFHQLVLRPKKINMCVSGYPTLPILGVQKFCP